MKKLMSVFAAIVLLLSCFTILTSAESDIVSGKIDIVTPANPRKGDK